MNNQLLERRIDEQQRRVEELESLLLGCPLVVAFLTPVDLVNLGRTCGRFGLVQDGRPLSLADEAARQLFGSAATDEEVHALPRYEDESHIALLRQLHLLRAPLQFKQLIGGDILYTSKSKSEVVSMPGDKCVDNFAVSNLVMRQGKHFARFDVSGAGDGGICVGIVRPLPGWEKEGEEFDPACVNRESDSVSQDLLAERTERWGESNVNCCAFGCSDGTCWCSDWSGNDDEEGWEGMESLEEDGTIGLLLDLDEGTLTVYKNERRLGELKNGLSGEYCWYATFNEGGNTVSIERSGTPP